MRDLLVRRQVQCDVDRDIILVVKDQHHGIQGIQGGSIVVAKVGISIFIQTPVIILEPVHHQKANEKLRQS